MCTVTISEQELCALLATEAHAVAFFEAIRWPHGRLCPACQSDQTKPKPSSPFFYICTTCRKHFSAKFGTVLQDSPLPVRTWLYAMYKVVVARKGVSSLQLSKELGLTQKATWHLVHRLKEACRTPPAQLSSVMEVDETYVGGRARNKHRKKGTRFPVGGVDKTIVPGMREWGGHTVTTIVDGTRRVDLLPEIVEYVRQGSLLLTDDHGAYKNSEAWGYEHA